MSSSKTMDSTLWKSVATAALLAGGGLSLVGIAASPTTSRVGYDLSHTVTFEIGIPGCDGDSITVDKVTGTSENMSAGNTYVIKGTYKLASQKRDAACVGDRQPG